jgi:hypothetical protein
MTSQVFQNEDIYCLIYAKNQSLNVPNVIVYAYGILK